MKELLKITRPPKLDFPVQIGDSIYRQEYIYTVEDINIEDFTVLLTIDGSHRFFCLEDFSSEIFGPYFELPKRLYNKSVPDDTEIPF